MSDQSAFRLIFKRDQTQGSRPTFSLAVSAEMPPEFEAAVRKYGLWNEVIYTDPSLEESRAAAVHKAERKAIARQRRTASFVSFADGEVAFFLFPFYVLWKILKLIYIIPFKIAWWLFKAHRTQATQVMRFAELKGGKTIRTKSLPEIIDAEEAIKQAVGNIETYVLAAGNYGGAAFEAGKAA